MERLLRGFRILEKTVTVLNGALLILITLLILVQVIARKIGISLAGTEEMARFSYVIYTFLAWPLASLYGTNIAITMVIDKFSQKTRLVLLVVFQMIMAVFSGFAAYSAYLQVRNQWGVLAPSNTWFLMHWLYLVVFVSLLCCVLFNIMRGVLLITGDMKYEPMSEKLEQALENSDQLCTENHEVDTI